MSMVLRWYLIKILTRNNSKNYGHTKQRVELNFGPFIYTQLLPPDGLLRRFMKTTNRIGRKVSTITVKRLEHKTSTELIRKQIVSLSDRSRAMSDMQRKENVSRRRD